MSMFIKLTQSGNGKPIYVAPRHISSFEDAEVFKGAIVWVVPHGAITVTEPADEILRLIDIAEDDSSYVRVLQ